MFFSLEKGASHLFPMMEGTCLWFLGVCWSD